MGIDTNQGTSDFEAFEAAGNIETGKPADGIEAVEDGKKADVPAPRRGPPKEAPATKEAPVAKPAAADDDDTGEDDEDGEDGEPKPKPTAREQQINRLKREKAELNRQLREARAGGDTDLSRRLANIEKGLSGGGDGDNSNSGKAAPDPTDTAKYPLGHLDDRYIEDKLEWLADSKATKQADAVLHRQQEHERNDAAARQQTDILEKVDDLSTKGADLYPDFQEEVVDTGMRGDWDLEQPTFEACHEADNGPQILYELSQDPKEARRVAKLSPYQQLKFVQEKDAEIGTGKKGRTKPAAGAPPINTARGANSRTVINPATDNLNDFEKAWEQDAKRTG